MKSNIYIPKTINIGYRNRSDTYTGKLAYVIYYDEKGKLRKEASWNSWRDKEIQNDEFENVPTSGFVLNKHAGGVENSWGWNARKSYCRIYDPRNFEFEITIENLLYILENTNVIKGKGLEGEFVYGWDGKDLVLIPVESPDYKEISEYNKIVHSNGSISAKDLIVGATYLTKNNEEFIYAGKFDYYSTGYKWIENGEYKISKSYKDIPSKLSRFACYRKIDHEYINNILYGKYFWFAYRDYDYEYINGERVNKSTYKWNFKQFNSIPKGKFIKCVYDKCSSEYADIFYAMEGSYKYSPYDSSKDKFFEIPFDDFVKEATRYGRYYDFEFISDQSGEKKLFKACVNLDGGFILKEHYVKKYGGFKENTTIFPSEIIKEECVNYLNNKKEIIKKRRMIPVTIEEMYRVMKPLYRQKYLANGREYERVWTL